MKLRNFFEIIGFKKAAKRFGYEIRPMTIPDFGIVKYAQWKHPLETEKTIDPKIVCSVSPNLTGLVSDTLTT
jgi:hypothetical protein